MNTALSFSTHRVTQRNWTEPFGSRAEYAAATESPSSASPTTLPHLGVQPVTTTVSLGTQPRWQLPSQLASGVSWQSGLGHSG